MQKIYVIWKNIVHSFQKPPIYRRRHYAKKIVKGKGINVLCMQSNMPRLTDEKSEADQRAEGMIVKMAEKKV